jgi:hypothetical protein
MTGGDSGEVSLRASGLFAVLAAKVKAVKGNLVHTVARRKIANLFNLVKDLIEITAKECLDFGPRANQFGRRVEKERACEWVIAIYNVFAVRLDGYTGASLDPDCA